MSYLDQLIRQVVINGTHVDRRADSHTLADSIAQCARGLSFHTYLLLLCKALEPPWGCHGSFFFSLFSFLSQEGGILDGLGAAETHGVDTN